LFLAVCIALGLAFFGIATRQRRVLYLSCEDREPVLHWRLNHICAQLGVKLGQLHGWLDIVDLVGHDCVLWAQDPRTGYTITPAFAELASRIEGQQTQVLVVDGVSDAFGGNENARTEVKRFVNALLGLIPLDGALLLLGHVSKPAAANGSTAEGYSGSTQWHNAARARWYLYPETEQSDDGGRAQRTGKLVLELQKSNLGRTDQSVSFQWDTDAHMFVAVGTFGTSTIDRKHRDETEQVNILRALPGCSLATPAPIIVPAAMQGQRTAYHVLSKRPEFPDSLRAGNAATRRRFWSQIEGLRQLGYIEERAYRRADGHKGVQLVLTTDGERRIGELKTSNSP
jgi:RecA-family ATPase